MSPERRRFGRRPLSLDVVVRLSAGGKRLHGFSADLSKSGIFVELEEPIPEGRRVDLLIRSDFLGCSVGTSGTVVHSLAGCGVGIRFSPQSEATRERIAAIVERLRQSA